MKIKIAVPSKGRISEPSINILEKAGLGLKDRESRKLISKTFNKDIDVLFARASDNGKSTVSEPRIAFVADENIYIEPLTKSVLNDITL